MLLAVALMLTACASVPENNHQTVDNITTVFIQLKVEEELALLILVSTDGTVNRLGRGVRVGGKQDWTISRTSEPLVERLKEHITDPVISSMGNTYTRPGHQGSSCDLSFSFRFSDGTENGSRILYNLDTFDIPLEVMYLIYRAMEITDPWYKMFTGGHENDNADSKSRCLPPFPP